MVIVDTIFHSFQQFITNDIPSILSLTSTSLKCLPLPSSPSSFSSLSFSDWLALAPLLTLVTLFSLYLLPSLFQREEENKKKRTFWLTRICLLRMMGLIYLAAFLTSSFQSRPLFGEKGLEPSSPRSRPIPAFRFLEWALSSSSSSGVPDLHLEIVSWVGVFLSLVLITSPISTFLIPLALWLLYLSIVNLESMVIRYGWEWLTLEAGFLAIFLSPLFSFSSFPSETPPSRVVLWLYRWLAFRLLFGAGMSKLGSYSSACWKELTCTTTHHMTQPMPNLFAWFAHRAPFSFHQCEVLLTFFEQLILPFFVLIPIRSLAIFGAVMECFFQFAIISTGNYAWINFMGILPCLSLLDDDFLSFFFSQSIVQEQERVVSYTSKERPTQTTKKVYHISRQIIYLSLAVFIVFHSVEPIKELYSPSPWLHYYDDYFFVTSQGVFGFINQKRIVLTLSYTNFSIPPNPNCQDQSGAIASGKDGRPLTCRDLAPLCGDRRHGGTLAMSCPLTCNKCEQEIPKDVEWFPLEFKNLPGSPNRTPWFNSPYHYRFDWEVWIQTTARLERAHGRLPIPPFIEIAISKILLGDRDTLSLFGTSLQEIKENLGGSETPQAVKAQYFEYHFSSWDQLMKEGLWWTRQPIEKNPPKLFLAQRVHGRGEESYPNYENRSWLLLLSVFGFFSCFFLVLVSSKMKISNRVRWAVLWSCGFSFGGYFLVALLSDYSPLSFVPFEMQEWLMKSSVSLVCVGFQVIFVWGVWVLPSFFPFFRYLLKKFQDPFGEMWWFSKKKGNRKLKKLL